MSRRGAIRVVRSAAADEGGLTLVETVVALFILGVVMVGVTATTIQSQGLARTSRAKAVATSIANETIETARGLDPGTITTGTIVTGRLESGTFFTITREAEWLPAAATGGACDSPVASDLAFLRMTVSVDWATNLGGPVVSEAAFTPTVNAFDFDLGHVAVQVLDRDAKPPSTSHLVTLQGGPDNITRTVATTSDGCAFFNHEKPGSYTVSVATVGHVGQQGGNPLTSSATVTSATIAGVQLDFDRAATLDLTVVGAFGAALPTDTADLDLVLKNTALLPSQLRVVTDAGGDEVVSDLFPFGSGYEVWMSAGCSDADPSGFGFQQVLAASPGASTVADLTLPAAAFSVVDGAGVPVAGGQVYLYHDLEDPAPPGGCGAPVEFDLGSSDATGALTVALPYGAWEVRVRGRTPVAAWPSIVVGDSTVDPASVAPTTVEVQP